MQNDLIVVWMKIYHNRQKRNILLGNSSPFIYNILFCDMKHFFLVLLFEKEFMKNTDEKSVNRRTCFKKRRHLRKKLIISGSELRKYLGLTKSWCIDRKKYEDKEKALILFH